MPCAREYRAVTSGVCVPASNERGGGSCRARGRKHDPKLLAAMPRFVVAETQPKRLAARGRSAPRETWRRWLIEGPLPRPLARWPENAPAAQQCFTNCRLLRQQCSRRLDGSDLQEGPLSACSLWFSRGRELGAGHGYRLNLRCTMHANRSPWGRRRRSSVGRAGVATSLVVSPRLRGSRHGCIHVCCA